MSNKKSFDEKMKAQTELKVISMQKFLQRKASVDISCDTNLKLLELIKQVAVVAGIEENTLRRKLAVVDMSKDTTYAYINTLIGLAMWPAETGANYDEVLENREKIKSLNINYNLLSAIKDTRGYHTFATVTTDEATTIDGVEPEPEEYQLNVLVFLDSLGIKIDETYPLGQIELSKWQGDELRAKAKAKADVAKLKEELKLHNQMKEAMIA